MMFWLSVAKDFCRNFSRSRVESEEEEAAPAEEGEAVEEGGGAAAEGILRTGQARRARACQMRHACVHPPFECACSLLLSRASSVAYFSFRAKCGCVYPRAVYLTAILAIGDPRPATPRLGLIFFRFCFLYFFTILFVLLEIANRLF